MVIMESPARSFPPKVERVNRADIEKNYSMLTLGSFALACITVFGCVVWACTKDSDQT
jgi:hypothetical protein